MAVPTLQIRALMLRQQGWESYVHSTPASFLHMKGGYPKPSICWVLDTSYLGLEPHPRCSARPSTDRPTVPQAYDPAGERGRGSAAVPAS